MNYVGPSSVDNTGNNYTISLVNKSAKVYPACLLPESKISIHSASNSPLRLEILTPYSNKPSVFRFTTGEITRKKVLKDLPLFPISNFDINDTDPEPAIPTCRICLEADNKEDLISPCSCRGFQKFVHQECIKTWLMKSDRVKSDISYCEVCKERFFMVFEYSTVFKFCNDNSCRFWLPFFIFFIMIAGILSFYFEGYMTNSPSGVIVVAISAIFGIVAVLTFYLAVVKLTSACFEKIVTGWKILSRDS